MQCLFCHSSNIDNAGFPRPTQFNNKIFHYKKCKDCGLVFIDPIPLAEDYSVMYASSYHEQFYFKDVIPDQTELFNLFEKFNKGKKLLDYGCGDASFLKFFHQKGYECTGVEYDPELVNRLRKENPGIKFFTVEQFWNEQNEYNIIFMGDVLEHIATPSLFLSDLGTRLTTSGLMAAQGPLENNFNPQNIRSISDAILWAYHNWAEFLRQSMGNKIFIESKASKNDYMEKLKMIYKNIIGNYNDGKTVESGLIQT